MSEQLRVVIVGGGTAGWMSAIALASVAGENVCKITLVESDEIASVGVGEATLPHIKEFNDRVGINEADMMRKTSGTIKLGIQFVDWGALGNSYVHPFGKYGAQIGGSAFHQQWARADKQKLVKNIDSYSYAIELALQNRFEFPVSDQSYINSTYSYAYHFDASLYAAYLRSLSEARGVRRVEGKITRVIGNKDTGAIESVELNDGRIIEGDFFIDCSGFKSLLLGKALNAEFEDWSQWLVCDRAYAVPCQNSMEIPPYTRSTAKQAGWQWKIPLQHRTGNGYVFCSNNISDDEAAHSLLQSLDGAPLADPKLIKFKAGRYKNTWERNCLAIGLASGFLEPLESTSIYLIQVAIMNFLQLFPQKDHNQLLANEYNRMMDYEYERIRDFLILHYHLNQRDDSELWRYCREMSVPESLSQKIDVFRKRGYIDIYKFGLFSQPSWISVFTGQGLRQEGFDPFAMNVSLDDVNAQMQALLKEIDERVGLVPAHDKFLADYCPAKL